MIPTWAIRPLIYVIVLAAILGGFAAFVNHERNVGAEKATIELNKAFREGVAQAEADAAFRLRHKVAEVEKSHAEDLARGETLVASNLAARTELERLRAHVRSHRPAAPSGPAASGPVADETAPYRAVVDACSVRYEAVEGVARGLANQVTGLQGFVRGIFAGEPNEMESTPLATPVGERFPAGTIGLVTQPTTGLADPSPLGKGAPP